MVNYAKYLNFTSNEEIKKQLNELENKVSF